MSGDRRETSVSLRVESNKQMSTKLYVGNLAFSVTENGLQDLFSEHGPVAETALVLDRATGQSRGFGFVTMATAEGAQAAIAALNGKEFQGRTLTVNEARPREERGGGGSFGGGGGGGGRGRGRGDRRY